MWNGAFPTSFSGDYYSDPVTVRTQCWAGQPIKRPTDSTREGRLSSVQTAVPLAEGHSTFEQANPDDQTVVAVRLPERQDGVSINKQQYTCIFGFTQKITGASQDIAGLELYDSTGQRHNVDTFSGLQDVIAEGEEVFLVQGTSESGNVDIAKRTGFVPGGYTNGTRQEIWLEENTDVTFENQDTAVGPIFSPFPTGGDTQTGGRGQSQVRHPGIRFDNTYSPPARVE